MKKLKLNIQRFASTNKTANYDLPQFVGTDKPTWLGDINEAMSDIDAGMHANATAISNMASDVETASATASQASQDVTTLTSSVNTLSSNVTAVTTTANNAQSTATSALNTANTANGKADTNAGNITTIQSDITTINSSITTINDNLNHLKDYSTNEVAIGTWIDGKTLYRKCFKKTGNLANIQSGISNLNDVINLTVMIKGSEQNASWRTIPWCFNNPTYESSYTGGAYIRASDALIGFQVGSGLTNTSIYIVIVEYTKTNS